MFRNYLTVALRNITRHKLYSFINVAGLAVGLACAIFIILFIRDELSYDSWIPDTRNLYLVDSGFLMPGHGVQHTPNSPFPVAPAMVAHIPEVTAQTHLLPQTMTLKVGDRLFSESVSVVDPGFFQVIKLPLVVGNPVQVFAQPESIVLSQTVARKLFGGADPIGRAVLLDGAHPVTVTGVLRDLPHNTQLVAKALIPNTSKADPTPQFYKRHWGSLDGESFVQLAPGSDPKRVIAEMRKIVNSNVNPRKWVGLDIPGSKLLQIHLTPFTGVHLAPNDYGGMTPGGSWVEIYGFGAIAALILLIACFNFTNLATARAMMRAREISLRKVMGAKRWQLIIQFLSESVLIACIALVLALAVVEMLLPSFDGFTGRPIVFHYLADWPLMLGIIAIATVAGLLGGCYPALVLSGFRPAATLMTNASGRGSSGVLRTVLVILQFSISIGLGIAAVVVFQQIRYAQTLDLGFDRSDVVVIENASDIPRQAREDLVHTLLAEPSIAGAAQSQATPFEGSTNIEDFHVPGSPETLLIRRWDIAPDYISLYGMRLVAGRLLSLDRAKDALPESDTAPVNIMISETAARRFGFTPQQAVGKTVRWTDRPATIVGVLTNSEIDGPRHEAPALIFDYNPRDMDEISIRIKPGDVEDALAAIDRDWHRFAPSFAIHRRFLNDTFERLFQADEQRGRIFAVFVGIAIFIACLGLFGLAAFTAERRTKEIGIRKTFGAKTRDIVRLLLWQFSIPVLIANIIAWPVAYYYLHNWLESYAYRIALNPLYFIAAGAVALVIAWATVFAHALRVARANPVHALRYE